MSFAQSSGPLIPLPRFYASLRFQSEGSALPTTSCLRLAASSTLEVVLIILGCYCTRQLAGVGQCTLRCMLARCQKHKYIQRCFTTFLQSYANDSYYITSC